MPPPTDPGDPAVHEPRSPCTKVCRIDPQHVWCAGCQRTPAEIGAWRDANAAERQAILARVRARRSCE